MLHADNLVERSGKLILRNLNTNSLNTATDTWSGALTGYPFYVINYETALIRDHVYYARFTYKFTTTNQSPAWARFYASDGTNAIQGITNPVANTEYTTSGVTRYFFRRSSTVGNLFSGPIEAISGAYFYVKNVLVYDVTDLYVRLKAKGIVTSDETLTTWCDNNLVHKPKNVNYDVTNLVSDTSSKAVIDKGNIVADDFIEADGMQYYSISNALRVNTYFDTASPVGVYNNSNNGTVTHTRVTDTTSPFYPKHPYVLKIVTNGTASPQAGGFTCLHTAAANKIFIETFVAKIPVGYSVVIHFNAQGTGASVTALTSLAGTGNWAEYKVLYKCGTEGTFNTGGHISITGTNDTSVTWYLAYINNCDITGKEYLKAYTALPGKLVLGSKYVYSAEINSINIVLNGNCAKQDTAMLSSGWTYDTTDYPTSSSCSAKCSIVQPVGAAGGGFGNYIQISPSLRYKISFWVKCKGDMTSFLTAIKYFTSENAELNHNNVMYVSDTMTTLTAALNAGDTQLTVASNANWTSNRTYSELGFRNWAYSYNNLGSQFHTTPITGIVSGTSGTNIITLKQAYTGTTRPVGTYVVEGYAGGTYPYPVEKSDLPTDNTWKYVEAYFGQANASWDGNDANGTWWAIPKDARKLILGLNISANDGTVPIKFADIRIEPVAGAGCSRCENKIQIGK